LTAANHQFAFNQATFGWNLPFVDFVSVVAESGAGGVGVWSDRLGGLSPEEAHRRIEDAGLRITALNRGGFFVAGSADGRRRAIDETLRQIDIACRIGTAVLLVVPGGMSDEVRDIERARDQVREGLAAVAAHASAAGVRLGIEPFHPALTASRGVINTLDSALDLCDGLGPPLGVVLDIYHLWWDPNVRAAIARAGDRILGHHLCDWKLQPVDVLTDRAIMGDGVADVVGITRAARRAGYSGLLEIEIFSRDDLWRRPAREVASLCLERARDCVAVAV
jgi:sugar phosphate isomerase/epimerase